jgi:hypothetical protein
MTIGPDRFTLSRWFLEADKGASSGGGSGSTDDDKGGESKDQKPGDGDDGKGETKPPDPPVEKQATIKLADGGTKVVIDGVEYVVQTKVNELVGSAREEGRTKGKTELEEEARKKALEEQGDFKSLYEKEVEKREAVERERDEERVKSLRNAAGAKFGLSPLLTERLVGTTEKELLADAERVSKELGERKPVDTEGGRGNRNRGKEGNAGTGEGQQPQRRYAFQQEGDVSWNTRQPIKTGT